MAGHSPAGKDAGRGQDGRGGTDGGHWALFGAEDFDDLTDARVGPEVVGAGLSTGQDEHVEIVGAHFVEGAIGKMSGLAGSDDGPGDGTGRGDLNARAAENIDDGDGFDLFEAGSEGNEYLFHGAGGGTTLRRWMSGTSSGPVT
mgnify:CR=1 FL=1